MRIQFRPANSLVEYILPIALVVIGSGTLLFALNAPDQIKNVVKGSNNGEFAGKQLIVKGSGEMNASKIPPELRKAYLAANGNASIEGETLCIHGSYCLTVPTIAGGAVAEVDGGLGGTTVKKLAQSLLDLAQQLESAGYPRDLISTIRELANKGHEQGDLLKGFDYLKNGISCGGDEADVDCNRISNDNEPGSANYIRNTLIGKTVEFSQIKNRLDLLISNNPILQNELPPEAINLINKASTNIQSASGSLKNCFTVDGVTICDGYQSGTANGFRSVNPGTFISMNANVICNAGEAGSSCTRIP